MKKPLSRAEYIRRAADAIYQTRTIQMIAHDLGLPPSEVDWSGPSRLVWSEVLVHAERNGQFESLQGHAGWVWTASFSADGTRVVTASFDKTARVWDARDGRLLATIQGHTGALTSTSFSAGGTRVATASYDHTARIWNLDPAVARSVGCALVRGKPVWDDPLRRDALRAACANVR